jgi:hypothetical protein
MSYEELQQFLDENHLIIESEAGDTPNLYENKPDTTTMTQTHIMSGVNPYTGKAIAKPIT